MNAPAVTHQQTSAYASPWSWNRRLVLLAWEFIWTFTCSWTPKPLNPWRLIILRIFGAAINGRPFVHARARIAQPWNLTLHHRACLGDRANVYSLGPVEIHEGATVAQEAYLCTGSHDFRSSDLPLITAPIVIGRGAFIGARAFILPGVTIGEHAVVGACAVVTKSVSSRVTVAGNPAVELPRKGSSVNAEFR